MGIKALFAIGNKYDSVWELRDSTIAYIKRRGLSDIVALGNASRIVRTSSLKEIEGLQKGMEVLGYNSNLDATSHLQREMEAPSVRERDF